MDKASRGVKEPAYFVMKYAGLRGEGWRVLTLPVEAQVAAIFLISVSWAPERGSAISERATF